MKPPAAAAAARPWETRERRGKLAVDPRLWRAVGALEVAAAVGIATGFVAPTVGVAALIGLALLMIGAIGAHLRASDVVGVIPAAVMLALAVALVGLLTVTPL